MPLIIKRKNRLFRDLKKHPGEMYVTDNLIAVLLPDARMLVITGDFKDITPEAANARLQQALNNLIDNN